MEITYLSGGIGILERIRNLWHELNTHHASVSKHFTSHFNSFTFETRIKTLNKKAKTGNVLIVVALETSSENEIGYCISSVDSHLQGEVDSIYVQPDYRKNGVARELMDRALDWLKSNQVDDIRIGVAYGNEETFKFYSKFGFLPRVTILQNQSEKQLTV